MSTLQDLLLSTYALLGKLSIVYSLVFRGEISYEPYSNVLNYDNLDDIQSLKENVISLAKSMLAELRQPQSTSISIRDFRQMLEDVLKLAEQYVGVLTPDLKILEKFKQEQKELWEKAVPEIIQDVEWIFQNRRLSSLMPKGWVAPDFLKRNRRAEPD